MKAPNKEMPCKIKLHYKHREQWATITVVDLSNVSFDEQQRAITPGQVAVFYDDDIVLGGGVIQKRKK
ncbi:aminomethyltransferase beta-barrel domain-containing protein [Anaerotignum sp.]|uniref:aminomethyltransferase beta-barrel domain-containing protein n=1 Tax=Anaerotignum sp. TaxID=2039241 RepID=UPI00289A5106|nr:aminomethyltransferase beta-barrel domain-containing protein [Anaerotignum sp.]